MSRFAAALAMTMLFACANSKPSATRTPTRSPIPSVAVSPHPSPAPSHTLSPKPSYEVRYIGVSVATVWTYPSSPRPVDAPALAVPAQPRRWVESMTNAQKLALVGRVQTQVLYGTKVYLLAQSGAWSDIAVPDQPSEKNRAGYPGWIPSRQLTSQAPPSGDHVTITAPTARSYDARTHERSLEFSYGTQLHVVRRGDANVEVELIDGGHVTIDRRDVTTASGDVLREARRFLGLPYLWGGTSGFGFDCSGLSYAVYRSLGITIPRDTDQQFKAGRSVALSDVRPGDVLYVADSSGAVIHDAIYYGSVDGKPSIIESPNTGKSVRIVGLSTHSYVGARRFLPS